MRLICKLASGWATACFLVVVAVFAVSAQTYEECPPYQICSRPRPVYPSEEETVYSSQEDEEYDPNRECSGEECSEENREPEIRKKPNIIFILLDDVGWNDVGWHNPKFHTPHMNKLAREGVILENHYSLPTCTPSRASFLTGYHASRLGLQRGVLQLLEPYGIPTKFRLLPEALKKEDYTTHALGKWHVGYCNRDYTPLARGFETHFGFYNGAENNYLHCNRDDTYFAPDQCSYFDFRHQWRKGKVYKNKFSGHLYNDEAVHLINTHDRSKPMFMYLALSHTHFPLQSPTEFCRGCEAYADKSPRHLMCCAMSAADSVVFNVTQALKKRRMYDNSFIVVVSDNGGSIHFGANNVPLKGNKGTLWEGGSKTPAFVHSPLLKKKGYKNKNLFQITDWYPTFVRMAGGKVDENMDGFDQWRTINTNKKSERNEILYNLDVQNGTWSAAVRVGDWKYIIVPPESQEPNYVIPESQVTDESFNTTFLISYTHPKVYRDAKEFLYNLRDDNQESENLVGSNNPVHQEKLKELRDFRLQYYISVMKHAVKIQNDPAGTPNKDGGWYWVGWCHSYKDVPDKKQFSDCIIDEPR